ncbi:MAG TPA: DoxX-like family protein, partial [Pseudoduganella sp.]
GGLLDPEALRMLERGNTGDPGPLLRLIGRPARPIASFVLDPRAERARAKLDWLLPILRISIALVWIITAIVSAFVYPVADSYELLARTGIPEALRPLMLYGASAFDMALGLDILLLKRRRWLWLAQLGLIGFYTVVIAFRLPEFLVHPYGPLTKNLPMLAAIWLLYQLEDEEK